MKVEIYISMNNLFDKFKPKCFLMNLRVEAQDVESRPGYKGI
jgi:hypothetical protein